MVSRITHHKRKTARTQLYSFHSLSKNSKQNEVTSLLLRKYSSLSFEPLPTKRAHDKILTIGISTSI
jgi:hypothetical protein